MEIVARRLDKAQKAAKGDKSALKEVDFLKRLNAHLESGLPARSMETEDDTEYEILHSTALLSLKPVIYACNMSEEDFTSGIEDNKNYLTVKEIAEREKAEILPICASLEAEISELSDEEKMMFLEEIGLERSGLDRMIQKCYHLLGLISYLTAGKPEVRAWTITKGTKAPQAAGKIHSDFERGFIRAEVIAYDDFINKCDGNMVTAKEKGLVRSEGKDYVMNDGDIVLFRFNV